MSKPTDLVQGTLDLLILRVVALEPMHGWAIMTADYFLSPGTFTGSRVWRSGKVEKDYSRRNAVTYIGPVNRPRG